MEAAEEGKQVVYGHFSSTQDVKSVRFSCDKILWTFMEEEKLMQSRPLREVRGQFGHKPVAQCQGHAAGWTQI